MLFSTHLCFNRTSNDSSSQLLPLIQRSVSIRSCSCDSRSKYSRGTCCCSHAIWQTKWLRSPRAFDWFDTSKFKLWLDLQSDTQCTFSHFQSIPTYTPICKWSNCPFAVNYFDFFDSLLTTSYLSRYFGGSEAGTNVTTPTTASPDLSTSTKSAF